MTEPKHTKEPWGYVERVSGSENHKGYRIYNPDKWYVADVYPINPDGIKGKELARRITSCLNLLEGVPTEKLESGKYRIILQNKTPRPLKPRVIGHDNTKKAIETYTYGPGHEPHVWNIYGADKETSEIVCVGEDTAQMVCRTLNLYGEESEKS